MKKKFDREKFLNSDEGKHLIKSVQFMADERVYGLSLLLSAVGYTSINDLIDLLKEIQGNFGNVLDPEVDYDVHEDIRKINDEYDLFLTIDDDGENTGVVFSDKKYLAMSDEEYASIMEEVDANRDWLVKVKWTRSDVDAFGAYWGLKSCIGKDEDSDDSDTDITDEDEEYDFPIN